MDISNKTAITEEMGLQKDWYEKAKKIKTIEEWTEFANHLFNDYLHDYGTACHAIAACSVAASWMGAELEGITGFQAGCIMWEFIRHWTKDNNKCGMKLVDYDDFLYPQYEDKYDKTINRENWEAIQKEAKKNIENGRNEIVAHEVLNHWKDIAAGKVPFGYRVIDD